MDDETSRSEYNNKRQTFGSLGVQQPRLTVIRLIVSSDMKNSGYFRLDNGPQLSKLELTISQ